MEISIYGNQGVTILTFKGKTITCRQLDLGGRTTEQYTLCPLSIVPNPKVLSDISIRMNLFQIDGNIKAIEQNIRLEVELRSKQEYELHQLKHQLKNIKDTVHEISQVIKDIR
jgi:septal ring factor EnvC (AmiA/AmiB activator)